MDPGRHSAFARRLEHPTAERPGQTANANHRHPLTNTADLPASPQLARGPTRGARPAALHYTPQFAALLGGNDSANVAYIKSRAFAASLSSGREGSRHRAGAICAVLACILVAGSATAVWHFSGNRIARAPGFAGTLTIADSSGGAAPGTRTAAFDVEASAPGTSGQAIAGRPADDPAAPATADAASMRRELQAAIDAAPFRASILGIATAGLPVGAGAFDTASEGQPEIGDPGPALDAAATAGPSAPLSNSPAGGQSPLSPAMQGDGLPSDGSSAGDPLSSGGHREAERSNYLAAFAREAFRTTAAVATVARSLKPGPAGTPEADSELDNAGDPSASVDQGSSGATQPTADGDDRRESGEPAASANHRGSRPAGDGDVADGGSKAGNEPSSGAGAQASSGSDDTGHRAGASASTDADPGSGSETTADASQSGKGHAKQGKSDSEDSRAGGQSQGAQAAGQQSDAPGQQGKAKDARARNDGGGPAGPSGDSAQDSGAQNGGEGDGGGDAGPAGKGHGDPGGGAGKGGGKEHGGKGNGGKDHGGKGGG